MYIRNVLLVLCVFLLAYGVTAQTSDNRFELTVAQDGSGDFTTIQ